MLNPLRPQSLRDDLPRYPPLLQLLRVTSGRVAGPSGSLGSTTPSGGVVFPYLYIASTQQSQTESLLPRDREPCLVSDMNGLGLSPGYYLGRLANSFGGLPVYEVGDRNSSSTPAVLAEEMRRNGIHVGTRPAFNFIEGDGITLRGVDQGTAADAVDLTITAVAETMRRNGVHVGTRPAFNFIEGVNVGLTADDNPITGACDLTISARGDVIVFQTTNNYLDPPPTIFAPTIFNFSGPPGWPGRTPGELGFSPVDNVLWIWNGSVWVEFCPCGTGSGSGSGSGGAAWYCVDPPGGSGSGSSNIIETACCPGKLLPTTLYAQFSGGTGDCACWNGSVVPLVRDPLESWWYGVVPVACNATAGEEPYTRTEFYLTCNADFVTTATPLWVLRVILSRPGHPMDDYSIDLLGNNCDPLNVSGTLRAVAETCSVFVTVTEVAP